LRIKGIIFIFLILLAGCKSSESPVTDTDLLDSSYIMQQDTILNTAITSLELVNPFNFSTKEKQLLKLAESRFYFDSMLRKPPKDLKLKYPDNLLKLGDSGTAVLQIKRKLSQLGLYTADTLTMQFDSNLKQSIQAFQRMHNLNADGVPGKNTYRYLAWPTERYLEKLKINQKRYENLPDSQPPTRIEVNIPEYALRLYHNDSLIQQFKVIVGKFKTQTPILTSEIDYLVFNPCWTVPHVIAVKSMLPKMKKDTNYLADRNMFITQNGQRVNSKEIDFSACSKDNFPYKIFQNASPGNALGQVKFMFDNPHAVYLHDTPQKYLFKKDYRTYSNGCIRLENAMQLAELILKIDKNTAVISNKLAPGYPVKTYLNKPIPIIIQYQTVRYNEKLEMVQFFSDCYGLDTL
jgi:murein L,D-transpeptidase YcbB/YkuD